MASLFDRFKKKRTATADVVEQLSETLTEVDEAGQEGVVIPDEAPLTLVVGFLPGVKQKDADSYVRGLMLKINNDLHNSGYNLVKFRGGFAYEIQEGGTGGSWLRSILSLLEEKKSVIVPAGTRFVKMELEESGIHCSLLRENDPEEQKALTPSKNGKLKEYHSYVQVWVSTAVGIAVFSVVTFTMTLWAQNLIAENGAEKIVIETMSKTQTLPILYWPEVIGEDMYVAKLEFSNSSWKPPIFKSFNEEPPMPEIIDPRMENDMMPPEVEDGFVPPPHIPGTPDITVNSQPNPRDALRVGAPSGPSIPMPATR